MAKKQIEGVYNIYANITDAITDGHGYDLTGNNRNKELYFSLNDTKLLTFWNKNGSIIPSRDYVYFVKNNVMNIKRARIITPGCPGLRAEKDGFAARLHFDAVDDNGNSSFGFGIKIFKYNEWENIDFNFKPFEQYQSENLDKWFQLRLVHTLERVSAVTIDDYNIQNAYIGQPVCFFLELEIDTAGLVNAYTSEIF